MHVAIMHREITRSCNAMNSGIDGKIPKNVRAMESPTQNAPREEKFVPWQIKTPDTFEKKTLESFLLLTFEMILL